MVRKIALSIVAVLSVCCMAIAQNVQVTGSVVDSAGEPIVGAAIVVAGTTTGVTSNVDGSFSINAPRNGKLVVSSLGYEEKTIDIAGKTSLNIVLADSSESIDDVIVVGYGTGKKVGTVIGSVDQVKAEKLENRPSNNIMDAMQGQVAGLQILSSSGELDATSTIRLHGLGSINADTEPLILLDGAPITTGTLLAMNQNDIQSINVLKDASATSIYGSRAANGVIYVTTKRGNYNEGATVTLRTQYSMSSATKPRVTPMNTDQYLDFASSIGALYAGLDPNNPEDVKSYRDMAVSYYGIDESINTNWFDELMNQGAPLYQVDLGVSGGTRKSTYYFSANYSDQDGILPGSTMERYTVRGNIETRIKEWIKTGMNLGMGYTHSTNTFSVASMGTNWFTNPVNAITLTPTYQDPYDENGEYKQLWEHTGGYPAGTVLHTLFPQNNQRLQFNGSMFLELQPVKGLTVRSQLALNGFDYKYNYLNSPDYYYNSGVGSMSNSFQRNYNWTWTNTAEYKLAIGEKHNITALVGQESMYGNSEYTKFGMKGLTDSRFPYPNHGTDLSGIPSYTLSEYAFNSVFGRVEYNFAEKYFVDASIRNDASSRFGAQNRNALFWSAGAMWNLKKEAFLADSDVISNLSAKVSYGTQGNSGVGNYLQYATLGATTYNGNNGWNLASAGNPMLGWEEQRTLTVGAEIELLKKIRLQVDWYRRQTADMLTEVPVPATTGFTSNWVNVGGMRNSGIDITLNYDIFQNKDWYVNFHATFNYNKNQITELWDGLEEYAVGETALMKIGEPYYVNYLQMRAGVDPENGYEMWYMEDGSTTYNYNEAPFLNTGKSFQAPYTGGFGVNVAWKGLSFVADFSWVHGNWLFNNSLYFSENPAFADFTTNQTTGMLDYWKQPGDQTKYGSLEYYAIMGSRNYYADDLLEQGSFLRLKNIQLAYTLPQKWFNNNKYISGVRVYVGARNLWTLTGYTGLDPETANDYTLDDYPASRQWTFGAEFKF